MSKTQICTGIVLMAIGCSPMIMTILYLHWREYKDRYYGREEE